jgi:DNA-damage-inducible protein J
MKGILGGTAFELPKHPKKAMSEEMLLEKLEKSKQSASARNYKPADSVVADMREKYSL